MKLAISYEYNCGTQVSGYIAKELIAALQSESLAEAGSDCGSKNYLEVELRKDNKKKYIYRYIIDGSKLVLLDDDTYDKYIGKTVKMRSPMMCLGIGKQRCICNKCAGDFYYKIGKKNIGLLCNKPGTELSQMNLQKFYENLVKTQVLDVNDLLI